MRVSLGQKSRRSLGLRIHAASPADFGELVADETDKWAKVVKFSGVKAD